MLRALVIVDHGSRSQEAHAHLEEIAARVRKAAPELHVEIAHMELAEPSLATAIERCLAQSLREIAIHPLFLVPGRHLKEDIPSLVETTRKAHPGVQIQLTDALGSVPGLERLILQTLDL